MWKIILGVVILIFIIIVVVVGIILYLRTTPINPISPILPIISPFYPIINPDGWQEGVVGTLTNATTGNDVLCITSPDSNNIGMVNPNKCVISFDVLRQGNNIIIKKGPSLFGYWYSDNNNLIAITTNQSNAGSFTYLNGRIVDNLVNPRVMVSLKNIPFSQNINIPTLVVVPFNVDDPSSRWIFKKL